MESSNEIIRTYPIEDFTDFENERKLFRPIALVFNGNEFHARRPLCLRNLNV